MTNATYIWTLVFSIIIYVFVVDENVQKFVYLMFQLLKINIIRFFFGLKLRVGLEFDTWRLKRSMKKILRERALDKGTQD